MTVRAIVAISVWTEQQGGLVTSAQAAAVGVDRATLHRLARVGALDRLTQGIYKLVGAPWSRNDVTRALWLQVEPGPLQPTERQAVVCRLSAAEVYGIGDPVAPAVQVTVPAARRLSRPGLELFIGDVADVEREWVDDVPVTRPARILRDLLTDGFNDLTYLSSIAIDAMSAGLLTAHELTDAFAPHADRFGLVTKDRRRWPRQIASAFTTGQAAA